MIEGAHLGVEGVDRRRRDGVLLRDVISCALAILLSCVGIQSQSSSSLSVRITSPLGRMGEPGTIRIVGQVRAGAGRSVSAVRFSVDGTLLGTVTSGPPYALEWTDDNPFQRREIVVEAEDSEGDIGRDRIVLEPYVVTELAEVTSVLVEAGVYDKQGRMVRGLSAPEFILEEDGVRETPDMVAQETIPTTFTLLVDSSQSMWRNMDFVRAAAGKLTAYLRPKDQVLVAPFSRQLRAVTGPTNDRQTISEAIGAINAQGGTAMRDSMIEIASRFSGVEGRRVIVLITDAYDEHSQSSPAEAVAALKQAGVTVYTVGIGGVAGISLRGHDELKTIAADTGGRAFFPSRPTELPNVYDVLANDAQLRYLITYTPANQKRDGTWRTISLRTFDESMTVKARDGYFAPKPPPVRAVLEFTAMDTRSQYLDIAREDLVVFEDGVEQKVETFQEATSPVSMVLVLDSSGSMKQASEQVVAAAATFVGALRPEDSLGMLTFADKVNVAHAITTNRAYYHRDARGVQGRGRHRSLRCALRLDAHAQGAQGQACSGGAHRRPRRGQPRDRAGERQTLGQRAASAARPGRHDVPGGPRHQDRPGSPEPAGDLLRRRGLLPAGGLRACRAVRPRHREPPAPLHRGLHLDQLRPATESGAAWRSALARRASALPAARGTSLPRGRRALP